jgi:hypothetical protein
MLSGHQATVRAFDPGLLLCKLAVDPAAQIAVDQLLQSPPAFTTGCSQTVVVDERMAIGASFDLDALRAMRGVAYGVEAGCGGRSEDQPESFGGNVFCDP